MVGVVASGLLTIGLPAGGARAQTAGDEKFSALLMESVEISNEINAETARESHKKCIAFGDKVAATPELDELQRGYMEAQTSGCIAYAMHSGQFSDATGDQCSWQYDYAERIVATLKLGLGKPAFVDAEATIREEVDRAVRWGSGFGCTQNFEQFRKVLE